MLINCWKLEIPLYFGVELTFNKKFHPWFSFLIVTQVWVRKYLFKHFIFTSFSNDSQSNFCRKPNIRQCKGRVEITSKETFYHQAEYSREVEQSRFFTTVKRRKRKTNAKMWDLAENRDRRKLYAGLVRGGSTLDRQTPSCGWCGNYIEDGACSVTPRGLSIRLDNH